jgi:hypothetical protein
MTRLIRRQTVTGDTTGKRPRDLKPDPISWVVEAAAVFTPCVKPIGTYHNDHHEAFDQPLLQLLRKSPAQAYVDIDEDVAGAESALKGLRNTPRMGRTVISSVADENLGCRVALTRCSAPATKLPQDAAQFHFALYAAASI